MSNENKKTAPESAKLDNSVSDEQLDKVAGGNKRQPGVGQVSLENSVADLNEDGNVDIHEVVTFNREQRDI